MERSVDGMIASVLRLRRTSSENEFDSSNCFGRRGSRGVGKVEAWSKVQTMLETDSSGCTRQGDNLRDNDALPLGDEWSL